MKSVRSILLVCSMLLCAAAPAIAQLPATPPPDKGFVIVGTTSVAHTNNVITVGTAGSGYTSLPTVAFTGGSGSVQAVGTATLKAVGSVTIAAGGSSYTVGDVLTLVGGTKTTTATFTVATVSSGAVTGVTITNAGNYTAPTSSGAATTGGTGTGCTLTVSFGVGTIVLTNTGSGYLTAPSVSFTGGGGSSAAHTVVLAAVPTVTANFKAIIPLADTVLSAVTFTERTRPEYDGDVDIIGKTLTKGVVYPVVGNSAAVASGHAMLILR